MKHFSHVRIESGAFEAGTVLVAELSGREAISRLYEFELRLATTEAGIDEAKLLTSGVTLVFEQKDPSGAMVEIRRVPGVIRSLVDRSLSEAGHREYLATLVPRVWHSTLTATSDVCMDLSVPDVIKQKLKEGAGLKPGDDVELRLRGTYTPREFTVQYKETHFAFISRLAEDFGIHYFFEEIDGKDVMVFGDENSAFKPTVPEASAFSRRGDRTEVFQLEAKHQLVTKNFVTRDYNYRNPAMEVSGQAALKVLGYGKYDEFGPHAKTPEEATFYARVRAEEAQARSLTFEGRSDLPGLRAGALLTVEGHSRGDIELVVTEVVHEITQPVFGQAPARDRPYTNVFRAILKKTVFRPARVTPKPVVHGVVTGVIQSSASTKLGAIDDQGRYRVAFLYDSVTGRGDGKASRPLRMAQPSAGSSRGFHSPLTVGTEVLIICLNGDPDRPLIVGAVTNPQTPSPVSSSNSEKSIWNTNLSSIAIDDQSARASISVAGDEHKIQIGEPEAPELGILLGTVQNHSEATDGAKTETNKEKSVYTDQLTVLAAKDILQAAGIPNPMSLWNKKVEEVKNKVGEFMKEAGEFADEFMQDYDKYVEHATEDKEEAEKALKKTVDKVKKDLKIEEKAKPKPVLDPITKQTRHETKEEAERRTFQEELKKDKKAQNELSDAMEDTLAAQDHHAEYNKPMTDAKDAVKKGEKEFDEKTKWVSDVGEDLAKGNVTKLAKKFAKKIPGQAGEFAQEALKVMEKTGALKAIDAAIKKMPAAKKLFSAMGKIFSKAANDTLDATVAGSQKLAGAIPKASKERNAASVGTFAKPFNIQMSRNSVGCYGAKNAFVFGRSNVTVASVMNASLLGAKRVDVKSRALVEVAAKDVMLTASKNVDLHSSDKVKIVAHSGDKKIDVPGGHSMYLHAKEGILMDSVEKDIEGKAKKNVKFTAQEENIEFVAKQMFKVKAEDKGIDIQAVKGKLEIMANDDQAAFRAKQKIVVQSMDSDFTVVSDKGKGTVKTSKELNLQSKEGTWDAGPKLTIKAKTFTVNGSKVELG